MRQKIFNFLTCSLMSSKCHLIDQLISFLVISFMGINENGKIEVVSLSPEEEKCELTSPFGLDKNHTLGSDYIIGNLDGEIHVYDGNFGIHKLSKDGHKWSLVANLNQTLKHFGMYFKYLCR